MPFTDDAPVELDTDSTPGICCTRVLNSSTTSMVRCSDALSASSMFAMMYPRSSFGRSVSGTLFPHQHMSATTPPKSSSVMIPCRTKNRTKNRYVRRLPSIAQLIGRKRIGGFSGGFLRSSEQRTGESVSATVVERQSATHIVTANCTYILPTIPW